MKWQVRYAAVMMVTSGAVFVYGTTDPVPARAYSDARANLVDCTRVVQNPHLSSTVGKGIDAKSQITCPYQQDSAEVNPALYRCDRGHGDTAPTEQWIFDNCDLVRHEFFQISPIVAGQKYTRQVPRVGGAEVHGDGWYVQDTVYVIENNGKRWADGKESRVVYINDPYA